MTRLDAIHQLADLRNQARAQIHPRSGLAIQEYIGTSTAAADAEALDMAIKALRAPRQDVPTWACIFACIALGAVIAACIIYSIT